MPEVVQAFTTREAERLTGLTARRLQYWDETDFIRPAVAARGGRGAPRLYSFRDIVQLRVAAILRDLLSLQALRRLKAALDVDAPFSSVRFGIMDDDDVVYLGPTGQLEDARRPGQIVATFDVPLMEIRGDLEQRIRSLRRRRGVGRISKEQGVMGGQPTLEGTRVTPEAIQRLLDAGWTRERILEEFPDLRPADITAARNYQPPPPRRRAAG